jgi:site-specific DNA-methyltransferase (adenine-specific)
MCWLEDETSFIFKQLITWNKINKGFNNTGFVHQRVSIDMMRNYYGGFTEYLLFYTFQDETGLMKIYGNDNCFKSIREYMQEQKELAGLKTCKEINQLLEVDDNGGGMASHYFSKKIGFKQWALPTQKMYLKLQSTGFFQREYEDLRREYEDLRREYEDLRYTFNNQKTHHSVWNYQTTPKVNHITPKPLELVKNIIKHSSNTNEIILDPFMGSGTTAIAAKQLNRKYIGFEINQEYHQNIQKQVTNIEKPLTTF